MMKHVTIRYQDICIFKLSFIYHTLHNLMCTEAHKMFHFLLLSGRVSRINPISVIGKEFRTILSMSNNKPLKASCSWYRVMETSLNPKCNIL